MKTINYQIIFYKTKCLFSTFFFFLIAVKECLGPRDGSQKADNKVVLPAIGGEGVQ
jgi:hypothetical protein